MNITSALFKAARASATISAAGKGPAALGRRYVRKAVYRKTNGMVASALFKFLKG